MRARGVIVSAAALLCLASASTATPPMVYNGAGPHLSLVVPDGGLGAGIGFGGHLIFGFSLGTAGALAIYPNLDFWYAGQNHYYYDYGYVNGNRVYLYRDYSVFDVGIKCDTRYYFPVPGSLPIKPFVGLGLGPNIAFVSWNYPQAVAPGGVIYPGGSDSNVGVGLDFLTGLDFSLGPRLIAFGEMRGDVGSDFDVFKMTFGITFPF